MRDKLFLLFYVFGVFLFTIIHDIFVIGVFSLILVLLSYNQAITLIRRSIISVLLFNGVITVSYILYAIFTGRQWLEYITLLNLRVFALTYLTFFFISKVNLFKALSFSKTLTYILILSYTQILIFKRQLNEFKLALQSRLLEKPSREDSYNFISTIFYYFLNKSMRNTKEISDAMKSRGFFVE